MGELAAEKHVQYILSVEKVCFFFYCTCTKYKQKYIILKYIYFLYNLKAGHLYCVQKKDSFESVVMEHLRMNGAYWGLTTLDLLGKLHTVDVDQIISWIIKCQHDSGL